MTCRRRAHAVWTSCDCPRCVIVMQRVRKLAHLGRLGPYPSEQAVELVREWRDAGYSSGWISSAAGVPVPWVTKVMAGDLRRPGRVLTARVMTADITSATKGFGPALGAQRRLRALAVNGWSIQNLAPLSGIPTSTLSRIRKGEAVDVTPARNRAIDDLYRTLRDQQGPSVQSATRARHLGWFPPDVWDDIDDRHEDPAAVADTRDVDEVAVLRLMAGDTVEATQDEKVEALRRLSDLGWSSAEIGDRLRVTDRTVDRWRAQHGIPSRWTA